MTSTAASIPAPDPARVVAGMPNDIPPSLGRIVRPVDYVRVLATPMRLRSPHFAVHHLEGRPLPPKRPAGRASAALPEKTGETGGMAPMADAGSCARVNASLSTELSTDLPLEGAPPVEDFTAEPVPNAGNAAAESAVALRWLGLVVPKRHAKRAVTRTLVKRQIRNVVADCAARLEPGLWVVRQRSPFDLTEFPSAASEALKKAARSELRALFERAMRGERDRLKPRGPSSGGKPSGGKAAGGRKTSSAARSASPSAAQAQAVEDVSGHAGDASSQLSEGPP